MSDSVWIYADDGRWYDDPLIRGDDWVLVLEDNDYDVLIIMAQQREKGQRRDEVLPVVSVESILSETGLPVASFSRKHGLHGYAIIGQCVAYSLRWKPDPIIPRRLFDASLPGRPNADKAIVTLVRRNITLPAQLQMKGPST